MKYSNKHLLTMSVLTFSIFSNFNLKAMEQEADLFADITMSDVPGNPTSSSSTQTSFYQINPDQSNDKKRKRSEDSEDNDSKAKGKKRRRSTKRTPKSATHNVIPTNEANTNDINPRKLLNLSKRIIRLINLLEKISSEKNDPLRKKIIEKKYIPLFKGKIQQLNFLQRTSAPTQKFYSLFKELLSQIDKNQISQILQELSTDEQNNQLLKFVIHLNSKIRTLLTRDFSTQDEFSDDSGSEADEEKQEDTEKFIQSNLEKYNNIKKAKRGEKNLSGLDFSEQDLTGTIFAEGADFSNANFTGTDLSDAKMNKGIFKKTILKGATLNKTELKEAFISESDLTGIKISKALVNGIKIQENTCLKNATLSDLCFSFATLQDLDCQHITIKNVSFFKSTFKNINMSSNSTLNDVSFEKTTLENTNIIDSEIETFVIKNTKVMCNKLYFTNSHLSKCYFIGKTTEKEDKRNNFFKNRPSKIKDFQCFFKDNAFNKVNSIMSLCDFSYARLQDVFFTNIFFELWGDFSCKKNLGNVSKIENTTFIAVYFYFYLNQNPHWYGGGMEVTRDEHQKVESLLKNKGAIVNLKISDGYKLYLDKQLYELEHPLPPTPTTWEKIKDGVNTAYQLATTVGTAVEATGKIYSAGKEVKEAFSGSKDSKSTSGSLL